MLYYNRTHETIDFTEPNFLPAGRADAPSGSSGEDNGQGEEHASFSAERRRGDGGSCAGPQQATERHHHPGQDHRRDYNPASHPRSGRRIHPHERRRQHRPDRNGATGRCAGHRQQHPSQRTRDFTLHPPPTNRRMDLAQPADPPDRPKAVPTDRHHAIDCQQQGAQHQFLPKHSIYIHILVRFSLHIEQGQPSFCLIRTEIK